MLDTRNSSIKGFLYGMGTGPGSVTVANNAVNVAVGQCADSTGAVMMNITGSQITKRMDTAWAAGNNAGGMSTALVTAGWLRVFVLSNAAGTSVDVGFDTSATAGNLVANAAVIAALGAAAKYRQVAWVYHTGAAGAGACRVYTQNGDVFTQDQPVAITTVASTTGLSVTIDAPPNTLAQINFGMYSTIGTGVAAYAAITDLSSTNYVPSSTQYTLRFITNVTTAMANTLVNVFTSASSQIRQRYTSGIVPTMDIQTLGWTDTRGR